MSLDLRQYAYDARSGRYKEVATGRFLPTDDLRAIVSERLEIGARIAQGLVDNLWSGSLDYDQFQASMMDVIKGNNAVMYALGRGGVRAMTNDDYAQLSEMVKSEAQYLDGFIDAIGQGELSLEQAKARASLYTDGPWEAYHLGETNNRKAAGFEQVRRIAVDDGGTCDDCREYASRGWQQIGRLPMPGKASACGRRCRCTMEYRVTDRRGRVTIAS